VDLPFIVTAIARQLNPRGVVTAAEQERLERVALEEGYDAVHRQLAIEAVGPDDLEASVHVPDSSLESLLEADDPLAAVEECVLREVLTRCAWRVQEAADQLGVSRVTLWRKLKEHGIERPG
jgi:transcriptional regulator of acetoin/glycerol metabolism